MSAEIEAQIAEVKADPAFLDGGAIGRDKLMSRYTQLTTELSVSRGEQSETALNGAGKIIPTIKPNASAGDERLKETIVGAYDAVLQPEDISFARLEGDADAEVLSEMSGYLWQLEAAQPVLDGIISDYNILSVQDKDATNQTREATHATLSARYGDKLDDAMTLAYSSAVSIGGQDLVDWLAETGMGNSHSLIMSLINMAEKRGHTI